MTGLALAAVLVVTSAAFGSGAFFFFALVTLVGLAVYWSTRRPSEEPPELERGPTAIQLCKQVDGRDQFVAVIQIRRRGSGRILHWVEAPTLRGVDLSGADLMQANLRQADLRGACLAGALCGVASFAGADLEGADLREADLHGADLSQTRLCGADLSGADLTGADLSNAHLTGVSHDGMTRWPAGFNPRAHSIAPLPGELTPSGAPEEDPQQRLLSPQDDEEAQA